MSRLILIKQARLLDPAECLDQVGDLLIAGGKIAGFGEHLSIDGASIDAEIIEAEGLCPSPGLVDMRVLFGEPGAEHKETFESGTQAAAAGGVTSLACLPNT
ncbi:MAG: dihydroorotase, partial [Geminicoccaceae bacterium]